MVLAGTALDAVLGTSGVFYGVNILAVFIPNVAVGVRRLHDIDKSGWA